MMMIQFLALLLVLNVIQAQTMTMGVWTFGARGVFFP